MAERRKVKIKINFGFPCEKILYENRSHALSTYQLHLILPLLSFEQEVIW